jgi:hypothetical protein
LVGGSIQEGSGLPVPQDCRGDSPHIQPLIGYADYACWQRSEKFDRRIQPQMDYWKQKLAGEAAISQLPNDHPRPLAQSSNADMIPLRIEGELYDHLSDYSRMNNMTLFPILLAAFCKTLSSYTHQDIIQIGSFFANRPLQELENILGPFVNGVVLRLDLSGNLDFNKLAARAAATVMEAQANQEVPIEKVVDISGSSATAANVRYLGLSSIS